MPSRSRTPLERLAVLVAVVTMLVPIGSPAQPSTPPAGFFGTGKATMQPVTLPVKPARVAYVPGTAGREAWGIALSSAPVPGWRPGGATDQVLFMHYLSGSGWTVDGPPVDAAGKVANPTLFALDIVAGGEGWAVGAAGVLVHHTPSGRWVVQSTRPTAGDLHAISLTKAGGSLSGYAVGDGPAIVRLSHGAWSADAGTELVTTDLTAVAASSTTAADAYAVSGNGSKDVNVYRRTLTGGEPTWVKVSTQPVFDGPHPVTKGDNLIVRQADTSSIAGDGSGGVWIGGVMYVTDASDPFGDDTGRPFVIHVTGSSTTSYCAPAYQFSGTAATEQAICDKTFPLAQYDVTSFAVLPKGEVFAGGQGLFHLTKRGWLREPDTNGYLISIAFASPTEGWVASTGEIYGAGGSAYSSVATIGHWTDQPELPRMARWSQPNDAPLEAVAIDPDGTGAMAVGDGGVAVQYVNGRAWDVMNTFAGELHALAYESSRSVWAVGSNGVITHFDGSKWHVFEPMTHRALFGVAFDRGIGFAVGADGTILRYAGGRWLPDRASESLTQQPLFAIARTSYGFIAVGDKATILEYRGGSWRHGESVAPMITRPQLGAPALYAAATTPSGIELVGGAGGSLLQRLPGGHFHPIPLPGTADVTKTALDGTVLTIAADDARVYASVGEDQDKYAGGRLLAPTSQVLMLDRDGWHDLQMDHVHTLVVSRDPSQPSDATYGIALEPSGRQAWAVGGTLVNSADSDGHSFGQPTSAIYRIDLDGDPSPPDDIVVPKLPAGQSFAFFSETSCAIPLCASYVGTGTKSDVTAALIQREVNLVSQSPNGPGFVMFGGDMRGSGHPEELAQFKDYISGFAKPFYAAIGTKDLFASSASAAVTTPSQTNVSPSNIYLSTFSSEHAPWGDGTPAKGLSPVPYPPGATPVAGEARTHYAFDVKNADGSTAFRVAVIDTSRRQVNSLGQNPSEHQLETFIPSVLAAGVPTVFVMNQPTMNPYYLGSSQANWIPPTDGNQFHATLAAPSVHTLGVFAGGFPINTVYRPIETTATGAGIPFYISGGGGRAAELTRLAADGFYPTWLLVTVNGSGANAKMTVKSFPLVDSVALRSVKGQYVQAGNVLQFTGKIRFPNGGFVDSNQTKDLYMDVPFPAPCLNPGLWSGTCLNQNTFVPDYAFSTKDPSVARFVKWDYARDLPFRDANGNLVPDSTDGYLCTFKYGGTDVYFQIGIHRAVRHIFVDGGFGPCVDKPVKRPAKIQFPPPPPVIRPAAPKPFYYHPLSHIGPALVFPPIPAPVVAPAPPGAPGVGRKEEHEVQTETEGHGDTSAFTALERQPVQRQIAVSDEPRRPVYLYAQARARHAPSTGEAWPALGGIALFALMSAAGLAAVRQRDPVANRARARSWRN